MNQAIKQIYNMHQLINQIIAYMISKNYTIFTDENQINIVYLEGISLDGSINKDSPNEWNDLRILFKYVNGEPIVLHAVTATTEPGFKPTIRPSNKKGVARIAFAQYTAWKMGYHKIAKYGNKHPALVQSSPVAVHRDFNKDGKRTGDKLEVGMFGINQHSTREGYKGSNVEDWSEGCLVGKDWKQHLEFLRLLKTDPRFQSNNDFVFTTTIIPGDELGQKV